MAITIPQPQSAREFARNKKFRQTISPTCTEGEVIESISINGNNVDLGVICSEAVIEGEYTSQFNEEVHYVSKGSSDLLETPTVVTGIENVPPNKDIIKFTTDTTISVEKTYEVIVTYKLSPEAGLTLTRSDSPGELPSPSGSAERKKNVVMACDIRFPTSTPTTPAVLWEQGAAGVGAYIGFSLATGSMTFRCRGGEGGLNMADGSIDDGVTVDITDFPTDGEIHTVVWEYRISPGRVRLWIDGELKGSSGTTTSLGLEGGQWAGGNPGGYTVRWSGVPRGEGTPSWSTVSSVSGASNLRIYANQLSNGAINDSETINITHKVNNNTDNYVNWLENYLNA